MSNQRRLNVVGAAQQKLGRKTIMDRALAQRYGAPYVHLAAFAIDVDRVHRARLDAPELPFGWEVLLTEQRLAAFMDETQVDPAPMLEDMCLGVMDLPRQPGDDPGPLGAQLPFAVYVGVAHGHLPNTVGGCFASWRKPPVELIEETAQLAAQTGLTAALARYCLQARLDPPLVEPVRTALTALAASGEQQKIEE